MTKGILLCAFGKRGYAFAAYNFAFSIKHHNPSIQIAVLHDGILNKELQDWQRDVFDIDIELPATLRDASGKFDPAIVKTNIYQFLPFDYTLFLDVDAMAMGDLDMIFDELIAAGGYYYSHILGTHTIEQGNIVAGMGWAFAEDIWQHYRLTEHDVLPAPNSSFQFIKKCDESKELYEQIKKNIDNPIPIESLRYKWGGGQPDELYLAVALCQKGITGQAGREYMYMTHYHPTMTLTEIAQMYPILCLWGNRNMARAMFTEYYDRQLIKMHSSKGLRHIFKWHFIRADKYANNAKTKEPLRIKKEELKLETALIPISDTTLITSDKLIQNYADSTGRNVRVTNWLNCSFIEYKGKTYFAYRMESAPFCTRMKIGLCLLNESLQPIQASNVLLDLHSDLKSAPLQSNKSFPKGYHVEDPRLFIYNDELYLSYTDGYQMAQAKINPETLQAVESFYIDKPKQGRTEKNWTFFEDVGKLYSVYSISPHVILEMDGSKFSPAYSEAFKHEWKWGELRGGTSPMRIGENFISFFHSAVSITYKNQLGRQYFMGAYMFSGKPPYEPLYISKEPIICGEEISQGIPRLSNKIFVVFPSGVIRKESSYLVSFGYNDLNCRYVEVSDELLKENLVEIKYENIEA